jgi:DNA polymerase III alpha subunit (gram-positive type)
MFEPLGAKPPVDCPLRKRDLCFLDVETTGLVFGYHELLEIGGLRTTPDGTEVLATWSRRVKPTAPERISPIALQLTGYTEIGWTSADDLGAPLWREFIDFASGCVPVCHNPSFDRAFLALAATESGIVDLELDYHWIGTESLAWQIYRAGKISKLSLAALCEHFDVGVEPMPHTALGGAAACRRVYLELMHRAAS